MLKQPLLPERFLCWLLTAFFLTFSAVAQETKEAENAATNENTTASQTVTDDAEAADGEDAEQERRRTYKLRRGAKEYFYEPGFAPFKPTQFTGIDEYDRSGRKLAMANFRIGRVLGTKKGITYTYLFGFTPLVTAFGNEIKNPDYVSYKHTPNEPRTIRKTSYGAGVSPANFRFCFRPRSRIKPFLQVGAGVLIFNKSMPLPESRKLQFTGDFGGGLQIHTTGNNVMTLGYRYFHISNGNLTPKVYNVGYNAQTFYIGYSLFK